jgi:NADH-quinone oxidoreductase subunit B
MDVKRPSIKGIPYEEFKDNAALEATLKELNEGGVNVLVGNLDHLIDWGFANSLWSLTFATSCCGIEFMAVGCARYDFARFGFEVTRNSPRQADLIMCAGTITHKMAPVMRRLYDEMAEPKYVVAVGGCAISGGPFKSSYHVVRGISEIVPVDVYVPGCPPRPEAILYGMMQLQRKVKLEKFIGGVNKKDKTLATIIVKDIPAQFRTMWKSWISREPEGMDGENPDLTVNNNKEGLE